MKRKFNDISKALNIVTEQKKLRIVKPEFLKCEICSEPVKNYNLCVGHHIYCSYDCYAIILLSMKQGLLHEKNEDVDYNDDLMIL